MRRIPGFSVISARAALAAFSLLTAVVAPSTAAWRQLNGPEPPVVFGLCETGGVMIMGTNESDSGDVYRSTDGGASWANAGLPNNGIQFEGVHFGAIYLGLYIDPVYRSTDLGLSWQSLDSQFSGAGELLSMASVGTTGYAGFASSSTKSVYRSTNSGASWSPLANAPVASCRALGAAGTTVIFGGAANGVFRSSNSGTSWTQSVGIPTNAEVNGIARVGGAWFASASVQFSPAVLGIYRSLDDGVSWSKVSTNLPAPSVAELHQLTADAGGALYVSLNAGPPSGGLYRSTDGGVTWASITASLAQPAPALALLVNASGIHAGFAYGLFRTTDVGASWTERDHGAAAIRGVEAMAASGSGLFLGLQPNGGGGRGIWQTTDAGESWTPRNSGLQANTAARAMLSTNDALYAGVYTSPRGVFRSTDQGVSWTQRSNGISSNTLLNALFESDGVLLAAAFEALYRSTNQGASWTTVPSADNGTCFARFGSDLFLGTGGDGVLRSTNLGATWSDASTGLDTFFERIANSFAIAGGQLFVATQGEGVYRWTGSQWVPTGLTNDFVNELLVHNDVLVAASALDGLFTSTDFGQSWLPFMEGFNGGEVYTLAVHDGLLYAGSRGHGIWARPLSELPSTTATPEPPLVGAGTRSILWARSEPNPATDFATLRFALSRAGELRVRLFDATGREVRGAMTERLTAGEHSLALDLRALPAGVAFYELTADGETRTGRIVRLRE